METPPPETAQQERDSDHLRLLSIFHYVNAGLSALGGCFPLIHVTVGTLILSGAGPFGELEGSGQAMPEFVGVFFIVIGLGISLLLWTWAALNFFAARYLAQRRRRTFCFVVSALNCLSMPLGTALGIFTIIVLERPTVRRLFATR